MKRIAAKIYLAILSVLVLSAHAQTNVLHLKSDVVDTIFGKAVADPYRWMEHLNSDTVGQWLTEQKKITKTEQKKFKGRMANAANNMQNNSWVSFTTSKKTGPYYFEMMNSGNPFNKSPVLYFRENEDDRFEEAFNPNYISKDISYTIHDWALSDSGRFLAVALSVGGSDWMEIRIRNLRKQKDMKDRIVNVKFSKIVWWRDGFFYAGYKSSGQTEALGGQQLYYHKLGDSQANDVLLMSIPADKGYSGISFKKTSNERYFVVNRNQKIGNTWYNMIVYKDLNEGLYDDWKCIVQSPAKDNAFFDVIDYADSSFIIKTNYKAPRGRVLLARLNETNQLKEIITEQKEVLKEVTYVYHQIVTIYFTAGEYEVGIFDTIGQYIHGLKFPPGIEVEGFEGNPDDSETTFYERAFYLPTMVEHYDFKTNTHTCTNKTKILFNGEGYETEVVKYKSKDGTEVAMYLTHKRGLKLKNNNPVILYGYGGFGVPVTPFYDYTNIVFFDNNGILAVPMIRGGGEYGKEWHEGGQRFNKQNSFDDFVAAAEYLTKGGYTTKEKLAIEGGSNGGLLVAAVMTQHPDLCKVVVAQAGVYDMLRFVRFTDGKYVIGEYGDPANPEDFFNLLSYSPLHNVKPGVAYPATLFIAGKNDDRVVPLHTYKLLARLQECSTGDAPHILYFEEDAGHNGATNHSDHVAQEGFVLAFIFTEMGLPIK